MIPQRNISLLSNRLAREGCRRIPEAVLERDYCLAWFLVGLSSSPICKSLIFKGGTALKRCYFSKYRFSEDLDFTLAEEMPLETILAGFEKVYAEVRLRKLWQVRLANQMATLPHFDEAYRAVQRSLRVAGLMRGWACGDATRSSLLFEPYQYQGLLPTNSTTDFLP